MVGDVVATATRRAGASTNTIAAITKSIFLETPVEVADIILIPGGHPRQLT